MLDSEKLAIAAHLHVALRRKTGRVTDTEWIVRSAEYAREVIRLARAEADQPELHDWALKLERALFPVPAQAVPPQVALPEPARDPGNRALTPGRTRYLSGLR